MHEGSTSVLRRVKKVRLGVLAVVLAAIAGTVATLAMLDGSAKETTMEASAPDFTLQATDGNTVSLSHFQGKKNVLLYFSMGQG